MRSLTQAFNIRQDNFLNQLSTSKEGVWVPSAIGDNHANKNHATKITRAQNHVVENLAVAKSRRTKITQETKTRGRESRSAKNTPPQKLAGTKSRDLKSRKYKITHSVTSKIKTIFLVIVDEFNFWFWTTSKPPSLLTKWWKFGGAWPLGIEPRWNPWKWWNTKWWNTMRRNTMFWVAKVQRTAKTSLKVWSWGRQAWLTSASLRKIKKKKLTGNWLATGPVFWQVCRNQPWSDRTHVSSTQKGKNRGYCLSRLQDETPRPFPVFFFLFFFLMKTKLAGFQRDFRLAGFW